MSGYEQDVLDSLTDEERAALQEDDGSGDKTTLGESVGDGTEGGEGGGKVNDKGGDDGKGQQDDQAGKGSAAAGDDAGGGKTNDDAGAGKGADAGAGDGGGDDTGGKSAAAADEGAAAAKEPIVPLLVANAPADADAKLKEISDKKGTLLDQFDNGDITAKEYQNQLDTLNREERGIENAVQKAQLASEMKQQQEMGAWLGQVNDFTKNTHPEYGTSKSRWMALDSFVKEIAAKPENANLDGRKILEMAHAKVVEDLGEAPQKPGTAKEEPAGGKKDEPGKPLKGAKIDPPKTLNKVPAADNQEITDGKFAALDRLGDTDPLALEEKLMKMSDAERDEYLASRG